MLMELVILFRVVTYHFCVNLWVQARLGKGKNHTQRQTSKKKQSLKKIIIFCSRYLKTAFRFLILKIVETIMVIILDFSFSFKKISNFKNRGFGCSLAEK